MTDSRPSDVLDRLAALAHALWCERMVEEGWSPGERYDPVRKHHDALVPYERLRPFDRRAARLAVECEEIAPRLATLVRHERGPARPFEAEELRVGLRVAYNDEGEEDETSQDQGVIESWELEEDGAVRLVRVRWDDGEVTEHAPAERELRRLE